MRPVTLLDESLILDPYPVLNSYDLTNVPVPLMLIEDVLVRGSVTGITSYPGVGKSWLTFEIMRAVATGGKFLDYFKAEPGAALFVGSDSSLYDYARQWNRLTSIERAQWEQAIIEPTPDELLRDFGPDWQIGKFESARFLLQSDFMLDDEAKTHRLIRTMAEFKHGPYSEITSSEENIFTGHTETEFEDMDREHGFDVVIFDTLSRLSRADQNDNTAMEGVFRNIRLIAEQTGAAVVLLHHNSKASDNNDGTDWRGAMSQIGALDSWIQLSKAKGDKSKVTVTYKKFRGITPDNFSYRMNVSEPDTASLVVLEGDTPPPDGHQSDSICASMLAFMKGHEEEARRVNKVHDLNVVEIAKSIFPEFEDLFPTFDKFKRAVTNRLYSTWGLVGFDGAPIEKVKSMGRSVTFRLVKKEEPRED